MAMRYGAYGREDNSLVIIHGATGAMTIKILKRLFDFENVNSRIGAAIEQDTPIQVSFSSFTLVHKQLYRILGPQEDEAICRADTEGTRLCSSDAQCVSERPL